VCIELSIDIHHKRGCQEQSSDVAIKGHRKEKWWNFFAKILPKIEKRWVKPGKNGEISGSDESL
jgi:hypothetical protein